MRRVLDGVLADVTREEGARTTLRASCLVEAGHPDFDGHFDMRPVLAACSQFEMLEALARVGLDPRLTFTAAPRVKFLGIIDPGSSIEVELAGAPGEDEGTDRPEFDFSISRNGKVVTRGKIRFARVAHAGQPGRDPSARPAPDVQ